MSKELKDAQEARDIALAKLEATQATIEASALEGVARLVESPQPVPVPWKEYPAYDEFNNWPAVHGRPYLWSDVDDRIDGRYRPIYETETDLRKIRADGRRLAAFFPIAQGALESLTNYVIGPGFEFNAQEAAPGSEDLVAKVQACIDRFLDVNDFIGVRDRQIHEESRTDGEVFATLSEDSGEVRLDLTAPEFIAEPANADAWERHLGTGHKLNDWKYGVHTTWNPRIMRQDTARPLGFHAVYDGVGDQFDYLPAERVEHVKRNVTEAGRRGISDFLSTLRDMELEAKISRNTGEGAAMLSAIAMIREHAPGVPKSTIESMVAANATSSYQKPTSTGTRTTYAEQLQPGTVKDVPSGMKAMFGPMGTLNHPVYLDVAQYILRRLGVRWNSPEYMISGDASNGNYASTLVAESPFVKAREQDQAFYGRHFERIIWKALRMYHSLGFFGNLPWATIRARVKIKVDAPAVASRDSEQAARVNEILHKNRVISKRTWATDAGFDYDEERQEMGEEPEACDCPEQAQAEPSRLSQVAESLRGLTFGLSENCGTGDGGFKSGNKCGKEEGGGAATAVRAKKVYKPSSAERLAVEDYSSDKFKDINAGLRSGNLSASDKRIVSDLDSFLQKSPKRPGATVRSFDIEPGGEIEKMLQPGAVFKDDAFVSTRAVPTATERAAFTKKNAPSGRVVMRIDGKSGVDISKISMNPGESEVLYPRGTRFRVSKVERTPQGGILAMLSEVGGDVQESCETYIAVDASGSLVVRW